MSSFDCRGIYGQFPYKRQHIYSVGDIKKDLGNQKFKEMKVQFVLLSHLQ